MEMETHDHKKVNQPGHEGHHGVHICHKCGWSFPNPHPSAKHRRAHKRICGTIDGYKLGSADQKGNVSSDDDDIKSPCSKGVERTVSKTSSSGIGSRSSRSNRSEDDVFADAVMEFTDGAAAVVVDSSDGARGQASAVEKAVDGDSDPTSIPEQAAVADAGNLHRHNDSNAIQLQAPGYPRTEHERVVNDNNTFEETLPSSMTDSTGSEFDAKGDEKMVSEKDLPSSAISTALDFDDESRSKEQFSEKMSAELAIAATDASGKKVDAVPSPGEVEDSLNSASSDSLLNVTGKQEICLDTAGVCFHEVNFVRKATDQFANSSQAMEDANEKPGRSGMIEEANLGGSKDHVQVLNIPGDLLSDEQPVIMAEDLKDHKEEKSTISPSLDSLKEVKILEHNEGFASKEIQSTASVNEPDYFEKLKFEGATFEVIDSRQGGAKEVAVDVKSTEEVTAEGTAGKTETTATNAGMCGSERVTVSVTVQEGVDYEQNEHSHKLESSEEQTSPSVYHHSLQNDNSTIQSVKDWGTGHENKNHSEINDVLENESIDRDEEKSLVRGEAYSEFANNVASEVGKITDLTEGGDQGDFNTKLSKPSEAELSFNDKVEPGKTFEHDLVGSDLVDSRNEDCGREMGGFNFQSDNLQELHGTRDVESSIDQSFGQENNELATVLAVTSIESTEEMKNADGCHDHMVSHSDQLSRVNENNGVLESNVPLYSIEGFPEGGKEPKASDENVCEEVGKVDLTLISDHDDDIDSAKVSKEVMQRQGDSASSVDTSAIESKVTKEISENASSIVNESTRVQGDVNSVKHDEVISALDYQADSSSQSDSLEGNWGSLSVLSASSDVPPAAEMGSLASRLPVQAEKVEVRLNAEAKAISAASDAFGSKNVDQKVRSTQKMEGANEDKALQIKDSPSMKKDKEIIDKVTSWGATKQHMALKTLLGEPDHMDDIPCTSSTNDTAKTENVVIDTQETESREGVKGAASKEWNSPARYPANIKRVKGKVRSRPYWAPFICCSSIETS